LLPLNPHDRTGHVPPTEEQTKAFQKVLRDRGYQVYIRTARGQEISAACGQLGGLAEEQKKTLQLAS
jgi:23S rRNA (adenine2503-C2)-methyltransferase